MKILTPSTICNTGTQGVHAFKLKAQRLYSENEKEETIPFRVFIGAHLY